MIDKEATTNAGRWMDFDTRSGANPVRINASGKF
jgi:hypothetical protein